MYRSFLICINKKRFLIVRVWLKKIYTIKGIICKMFTSWGYAGNPSGGGIPCKIWISHVIVHKHGFPAVGGIPWLVDKQVNPLILNTFIAWEPHLLTISWILLYLKDLPVICWRVMVSRVARCGEVQLYVHVICIIIPCSSDCGDIYGIFYFKNAQRQTEYIVPL